MVKGSKKSVESVESHEEELNILGSETVTNDSSESSNTAEVGDQIPSKASVVAVKEKKLVVNPKLQTSLSIEQNRNWTWSQVREWLKNR